MKRTITNKYEIHFDYHDHSVLGYLVGGELTTDEPTDEQKETFEGDWGPVTEADVWSFIHNGDRQPVTFWTGFDRFTTYYPRHNDDYRFLVVEVKLTRG